VNHPFTAGLAIYRMPDKEAWRRHSLHPQDGNGASVNIRFCRMASTTPFPVEQFNRLADARQPEDPLVYLGVSRCSQRLRNASCSLR
jgi:hypothetical protein